MNMKTAIVGLGYVGLPLSLQFARSGVTVIGLDIDTKKVDLLNQGKSFIKHISSEAVADAVAHSQLPRISNGYARWTPSSSACPHR
jgi:UDP-N-acetyl-D-glucosamine dehydrogenase